MYRGPLPPVSNRQSWDLICRITNPVTGDPVDLTGCTIRVELRSRLYGGTALAASTADGTITLLDETLDSGAVVSPIFQASFSVTQMESLCSGTWDIGCVIVRNGKTLQLLAAQLPVVDGVVQR
jgi:hypothetical protein